MKAVVRRVSDHHFLFSIRGMQGDIDVQLNSDDISFGPSPKELLLAALCGCTGTDVVDLLKKFNVVYESIQIEAKSGLTEHHPKMFAEIFLDYNLTGDSIHAESVTEAVYRSTHQYSGTAAMLVKACPITYRISINGAVIATGAADFAGR